MQKDPTDLRGISNDRKHLHGRAASAAAQRVHFRNLGKKPCPSGRGFPGGVGLLGSILGGCSGADAGTGCHANFEEAPIARLASTVEVNIKATMHLTYLLLPELRRQRRSTIINVASLDAFYPMPAMAVFAASKSFVLSFSLALREKLSGTGVRVGALCPAGIVTNRETADQVGAQGFFGRITTWEPERVVAVAIGQGLRGRAVIIPGAANRLLRWAGQASPRWLVVRLIGSRWRKTEAAIEERGGRL